MLNQSISRVHKLYKNRYEGVDTNLVRSNDLHINLHVYLVAKLWHDKRKNDQEKDIIIPSALSVGIIGEGDAEQM